jgi:hypothetical protein
MMSRAAIYKAIYDRFCQPLLKQLEDPVGSQEECLRQILDRAKGTLFGKDHGFGDIKSIEEYQRRVRVSTYSSMQPYLARTMQGEENVLFPDRIVCFLITSGTTGDPKLYPFGEQGSEEVLVDAVRTGTFYIVHNNRYDLLDGPRLRFPAPSVVGQKVGKYQVAFISGALSVAPIPSQLSLLAQADRRAIPPDDVLNEMDWNKRFYLTARYAVAADVRAVTGVSSNIVSLLRKISTGFVDQLLADPAVDPATKERLRQSTQDGVLDLRKLWPNFRVVFHSGVSVTPYRRVIHELLGDVDLWEAYGATEGWFGTQVYMDKGIFPYVDRIFYEFVPEDGKDSSPVVLSEVRTGTPYRVIVTTRGGFYRYDIGDLIEFTSASPPSFRVIGRKNSLVSLAGERMAEELFLRTLERACAQRGTNFVDFALLPEVSANAIRYLLFIEFTQVPRNLEEFTSFVDERLGLANIMYGAQRQANVIARPAIIPVQPGGFEVLLQRRRKVLGQTKVPRLLTPEMAALLPRLAAKVSQDRRAARTSRPRMR